MPDNQHVIQTLQKLVETCRDGQEGYRNAAEHVKDASLKHFFNERSLERAQFAGDLENEILHWGDHDPSRGASTAHLLRNVWVDVKAALGGGEKTILNSVESGEDTARDRYEEAMRADLPTGPRELVAKQAALVLAAHDRVRELRDTWKHAA